MSITSTFTNTATAWGATSPIRPGVVANSACFESTNGLTAHQGTAWNSAKLTNE